MALSPGTRLGHDDVTALIGEGGMGTWLASSQHIAQRRHIMNRRQFLATSTAAVIDVARN